MEINNFEIRCNIKFMVKLEWKGTEIMEALGKAYGINAPKQTAVYKWIRRFQEGREDLEDDPRIGRPKTSRNDEKVNAVRNLIDEDQRITVIQVAESLDISCGTVHSILHEDLGLSKLSARWVPKALRPDQLVVRTDLSISILSKIEADEERFMGRIITGDETWIYQYDPETKQWVPRGSSGPIKFKSERSAQKVMATVFWDSHGVIMVDYLEGQRTITGAYYAGVIRKLRAALVKKRRGKLHSGILFHHDNAPAHTARAARDVLREFRWEVLPHPPYSPDLAPSDFFLFPKLKESLKGIRFASTDEAKNAANTWFQTRPDKFFRDGLSTWKHRLEKCIDQDGNYVEK
jgi:histone-lysine N-methyltransferase SETMAR